eukprot:15475067-Alexandrium_andersonii.AAC.1
MLRTPPGGAPRTRHLRRWHAVAPFGRRSAVPFAPRVGARKLGPAAGSPSRKARVSELQGEA